MGVESSMTFLDVFNDALSELERTMPIPDDPAPPIFITGVPRSGTTLVNQLLAAYADVGYVNNLMARFWRAPAVGARLSLEFIGKSSFSGQSRYGRTTRIEEPHEFGAFWRARLRYAAMDQRIDDADIDWGLLVQELARTAGVFGRSVVYKVFHLVWHLSTFQRFWPEAHWIWIRRDPIANAMSLLRFREERAGDLTSWVSVKPLGAHKFVTCTPEVQVAAQVLLMEREIQKGFSRLTSGVSCQLWLEDLWSQPVREIEALASKCGVRVDHEALKAGASLVRPSMTDADAKSRKRVERAFNEVRQLL